MGREDKSEKKEKKEQDISDEGMPETFAASISATTSTLRVYEDVTVDIDLDLVRRSQEGDTAALQELVVKYQKWVYSLCYRVLGNHADADDIAQETFVAVYRHITKFRPQPKATFAGWLYRITVNLCRNQIRKQKRRREESLDSPAYLTDTEEKQPRLADRIPDGSMNPRKDALNQELSNLIESALNSLSAEHRMAFILHEYQELSYKEIADIMRCPIGTVMSRLYHAKRELREKLKKYL
ncbi:MAG: sigma-70 family RNA polymerase sigma factor [bacterium]|nr:sigma-70 family RNA polymerase sigma factor [bacterium]